MASRTRKKCSPACTCGRHHVPAERRDKISASMRGNTSGSANKGQKRPNNGKGSRPAHRSEEAKRKTSESLRKAWAQDDNPWAERPTREYKPSSIERALHTALDELGIKYKVGPLVKTPEGNFRPDLLLEDGRYVEVNGCFWHCCPECYPDPTDLQLMLKKKDEARMEALKSVNVYPVVIWEHQIRDQV